MTDRIKPGSVAASDFSITPIASGSDDDGEGMLVTGPQGVPLLEIKADDEWIACLPGGAGEEVLHATAGVAKALAFHLQDAQRLELVSFARSAGVEAVELVFASAFDDSELRKRVDPKRTQAVQRAAGRVIGLLVHNALERNVSDAQLEDHAQAAIDTFEVLLGGNGRQLKAVIDALEPPHENDPSKINVDEARARARLRLQAMYRKIMEESLTVADLRDWGLSRQRVGQLRDEQRLFAIKVPYHRELFHPTWQFTAEHRPRPIMPTLLRAAKDARLDAIGFHQLMTGRREGGRTGVQLLDAGREDLVLSLIGSSDR
ncbi:MAG: hypothetical protein V7607_2647 [Solirubrobacteraceae bacterium]